MSQTVQSPPVRPGGLVTIAYLKARLDEGTDHLGIFAPLVLDVVGQMASNSFSVAEVQEGLAKRHNLAMPQQAIVTLLKRLISKKLVDRDSGRYWRTSKCPTSVKDLTKEKSRIEVQQRCLADAFRVHASRRQLDLASTEIALTMLFKFLEEQQVELLLGDQSEAHVKTSTSSKERAIIAEFVQHVVQDDPPLAATVRGILEGLVLYHAAFLPDLEVSTRRFKNLTVFLDSVLIRQALGYEGSALETLQKDTIQVLKAGGVRCVVFDKTIHEIRRILSMYEDRLGTEDGRKSIKQVPMARHFLTNHFSPSDVREISALLEHNILAAGIEIEQMPSRLAEHTASESKLAARLADRYTKDELEPRVVHDVDCVAAILTLRKGQTAQILEDARFVFATSSPLVIQNTRLWYEEDENGGGIEPIVHIRALSNLAWLKKPKLCGKFKEHELVAMCAAALRPRPETWQRFLIHLDSLRKSKRITSDEMTAVLVSAMSDRLLREAERDDDSLNDIDAVTLDEIVERVKESYQAESDARVQAIKDEYEARVQALESAVASEIARAESAEGVLAEEAKKHSLKIEHRARLYARCITTGGYCLMITMVTVGALALIIEQWHRAGWLGFLILIGVCAFLFMEYMGILRHVSKCRDAIEASLTTRFQGNVESEKLHN